MAAECIACMEELVAGSDVFRCDGTRKISGLTCNTLYCTGCMDRMLQSVSNCGVCKNRFSVRRIDTLRSVVIEADQGAAAVPLDVSRKLAASGTIGSEWLEKKRSAQAALDGTAEDAALAHKLAAELEEEAREEARRESKALEERDRAFAQQIVERERAASAAVMAFAARGAPPPRTTTAPPRPTGHSGPPAKKQRSSGGGSGGGRSSSVATSRPVATPAVASSAAAPARAPPVRPTFGWQFGERQRGVVFWDPMDHTDAIIVEAARRTVHRSGRYAQVELALRRGRYRFDFAAMTQTNAQTGKVRPIQRWPPWEEQRSGGGGGGGGSSGGGGGRGGGGGGARTGAGGGGGGNDVIVLC